MKKIFALILSACLLAAIGTISNSCAPSETPEVDTTRLVSSPSSLSLTAGDSAGAASVFLTCGCNYEPLVVTGYGDTSVIHFSYGDTSLTTSIQSHPVYVNIHPSVNSHDTSNSWVSLAYQDESAGGSLLLDTVFVSAKY